MSGRGGGGGGGGGRGGGGEIVMCFYSHNREATMFGLFCCCWGMRGGEGKREIQH